MLNYLLHHIHEWYVQDFFIVYLVAFVAAKISFSKEEKILYKLNNECL